MWIKKGMLPQQGLKNVYKKKECCRSRDLKMCIKKGMLPQQVP
jgi:hypothetical protein